MAVPFRIGVMQLTMEPLDEMLASARAMDEAGLDTIWLAEAYPWWRKHGMEARSSTVVSALMARETKRLTIGWGIIAASTRHPVQVAMDARVVQEAAGPGRFIVGFGTSKIFLNNTKMQTRKTLGPMRDAVEIVRGVLGGERFEYDGDTWSADVPALQAEAHTPRDVPPVYVAATAPKMQALAGEIADGCLTPSITTPAFVRYTCGNVKSDIDIGCTVVASIHATDRDRGRDGAREIAGMYLANKVQNIQGSADTLLDLAGLEQEEIRPVAEAMERGGRLAAKELVTDAILDKCKPIAGTPEDCIAAIEEYKDAGCTHVMLELWGADRHEQIQPLRRARAATCTRLTGRCLCGQNATVSCRWLPPARPARRAGAGIAGSRPFRGSCGKTVTVSWRWLPPWVTSPPPGVAPLQGRSDQKRLPGAQAWFKARFGSRWGGMRINKSRLVETASAMIDVHSFTGAEQKMAELLAGLYEQMGLQVQWQQVEDGRANALGTWRGSGGGKTLMFNGHMDTSYSGREPWLRDVPGFQPSAFVKNGRLYGLGISNMKGALACYVEAVRSLQDAGVVLRGDVLIAAVCGEIEKTQHAEAQGAQYRGYAAGTRYLVSHGGVADMCLLGEPTEGKVVLGHFGALWLRIRVHGNFIHTAFSEGKRGENSILRMHEVTSAVLEWIPTWEQDPSNSYRGTNAIVNVGAVRGGFGWRVSRTPHHTDLHLDIRVPPTKEMGVARREVLDFVRTLGARFPGYGIEGEVYVTAPGAEIDEHHELVQAVDAAHEQVFGSVPARDVTRWFSDASALTRYGIPTLNYGTSTGLMDVELGENLDIDGLVKTAETYALVAQRICA